MVTAVITGANSGLGLETAKALFGKGFKVVLAVRNVKDGEAAKQRILEETGEGEVIVMKCDLCQIDSIKQFAESLKNEGNSLDILVCNAGIMNHPFELCSNEVEIHFQSNYLGHFYLVEELFRLKLIEETRIVLVSSGFYKNVHEMFEASDVKGQIKEPRHPNYYYSMSKLANCLHLIWLKDKLAKEAPNSIVVGVRPGFVRGTNLGRNTNIIMRMVAFPLIYMVAKNVHQGSSSIIYCATTPSTNLESGSLYADCKKEPLSGMLFHHLCNKMKVWLTVAILNLSVLPFVSSENKNLASIPSLLKDVTPEQKSAVEAILLNRQQSQNAMDAALDGWAKDVGEGFYKRYTDLKAAFLDAKKEMDEEYKAKLGKMTDPDLVKVANQISDITSNNDMPVGEQRTKVTALIDAQTPEMKAKIAANPPY
uniref:DUF148 domain-containing protein n=1 Tax=Rhabditophanes sp. KR3021 TaxID=114890 RepID=A0AC35U9U9_9BILA